MKRGATMKIEDNRHFFSPKTSRNTANDMKFQELFKSFLDQFEEESRLDRTIDSTVNTAFHDPNLTCYTPCYENKHGN